MLPTKSSVIELLPISKAKILQRLNEAKDFLKSEKERGVGIAVSSNNTSSTPQIPFEIACKYVYPGPNNFQMTEREQTCDSDRRESLYILVNVENLFAHQGMKKHRFPLAAFAVANALMLTRPLQALAETCEANNSLFDMPLLLAVALIGATVGGECRISSRVFSLKLGKQETCCLLARQRKGELKRLNDQLRQINAALRKQAKIESYAPTLSYAPVGSRIAEDEVIVDSRKHELISSLKSGKNFLRNQDPGKACEAFKAALELAQNLKDPIEEKKAARGLGASLQRLGKYREAIKYHSMVLEISDREGEDSGNTEAYGAIADCYTELGDLEQAGKFYDKYIMRLED
ncbi:Tetratricopeptide repeat-containing domain [Macleaya cordata]|uniref:Tetratricopeptide repeat-containing domain n=1 Tax=Macleaya cordata TaxID=56857 RepID=A0A200Q170_MACCD|nr:Tetratricopeptide repeat-containing domain [Macleaya cordata]